MFAYTIRPTHEQNAISRVFFAFRIYVLAREAGLKSPTRTRGGFQKLIYEPDNKHPPTPLTRYHTRGTANTPSPLQRLDSLGTTSLTLTIFVIWYIRPFLNPPGGAIQHFDPPGCAVP